MHEIFFFAQYITHKQRNDGDRAGHTHVDI